VIGTAVERVTAHLHITQLEWPSSDGVERWCVRGTQPTAGCDLRIKTSSRTLILSSPQEREMDEHFAGAANAMSSPKPIVVIDGKQTQMALVDELGRPAPVISVQDTEAEEG